MRPITIFGSTPSARRTFGLGDVLALLIVLVVLYVGARLAFDAPAVVTGPTIDLSPRALPWYAALSTGRMTAAYLLSMLFTLVYGRIAAYNARAEKVMMPLLDVLQSVPILSFLPVVLLGLSAFLPETLAVELAAVVLIFTSQVWNLTFAWFQSLTTIPKELREASSIFRLNGWIQFKTLELPFAASSLIWNSIMSWAGGWFFLMAAEMFTVGRRDFRLPGLGSYLQEAAIQSNFRAIFWGLGVLILLIVLLDQLVWRPLLTWAERFKVEMVEGSRPTTSWFYEIWRSARLANWLNTRLAAPLLERFDGYMIRRFPAQTAPAAPQARSWWQVIAGVLLVGVLLYGAFRAGDMLLTLPPAQWGAIAVGLGATLLRVMVVLLLALAWTVPVGVAIGTNPRLAAVLQPISQIAASIPATALFPVLLLVMLTLPAGLELAAVLLMLLGSQWYLLFNVIAGAGTIPEDLKHTADLLQLSRVDRWRILILPALFPFLVTGAITAGGGAWNASIVAEYVEFDEQTFHITGLGAIIAESTARGDYALLLAATLAMVLAVVVINRLLWRPLYRLAEEKYRME
jgi:NitT/TauT family transport system permease protein